MTTARHDMAAPSLSAGIPCCRSKHAVRPATTRFWSLRGRLPAIIQSLPNVLPSILVLTCAATALWFSELLALRRSEMLWEEAEIAITKRWSWGKEGPTKTLTKAEGHVLLHPALSYHGKEWHAQTPYAKATDFVFPSLTAEGRLPPSPAIFVAIFGQQL
jgi:integrase